MSAYVIIVYTDEPREAPTVNIFPTTEAAERFVIEDAADEWRHFEIDPDPEAPPEPTTIEEAREVYEYIGSYRRLHLLPEGHTNVYEHDA